MWRVTIICFIIFVGLIDAVIMVRFFLDFLELELALLYLCIGSAGMSLTAGHLLYARLVAVFTEVLRVLKSLLSLQLSL